MRSVSPAFDDKYVYCGNGGSTGSMIAVDKTTGNRVSYLTNADGTSGPAGGVYAGPVISKQGMMYIMCTNYGMFGVAKLLWLRRQYFQPMGHGEHLTVV